MNSFVVSDSMHPDSQVNVVPWSARDICVEDNQPATWSVRTGEDSNLLAMLVGTGKTKDGYSYIALIGSNGVSKRHVCKDHEEFYKVQCLVKTLADLSSLHENNLFI